MYRFIVSVMKIIHRNHPAPHNPPDISMGNFDIGNGVLFSGGAAACVLLAAHNEDTDEGLVGHFASLVPMREGVRSDYGRFRRAVLAIPELGVEDLTTIWLGGTAFRGADTRINDSLEADRETALHTVRTIIEEPKELVIDWAEPDTATDIELHCRLGALVVYSYDGDEIPKS